MNENRMSELEKKLHDAQVQKQPKEVIEPVVSVQSTLVFPENHLEEDIFGQNTEVMDECEQANVFERNFIAASLERQRATMKPETHPDFDGENCLECGDGIPVERLNMHKIYCVMCQTAIEKRKKMRGY